jgi:hypothetical protein
VGASSYAAAPKQGDLEALLRETFAGTKHEAEVERIIRRFDADIRWFAERGIYPDGVNVGGAVAAGAGLGVEGGINIELQPMEGDKVTVTLIRYVGGNFDAGVNADLGLAVGLNFDTHGKDRTDDSADWSVGVAGDIAFFGGIGGSLNLTAGKSDEAWISKLRQAERLHAYGRRHKDAAKKVQANRMAREALEEALQTPRSWMTDYNANVASFGGGFTVSVDDNKTIKTYEIPRSEVKAEVEKLLAHSKKEFVVAHRKWTRTRPAS